MFGTDEIQDISTNRESVTLQSEVSLTNELSDPGKVRITPTASFQNAVLSTVYQETKQQQVRSIELCRVWITSQPKLEWPDVSWTFVWDRIDPETCYQLMQANCCTTASIGLGFCVRDRVLVSDTGSVSYLNYKFVLFSLCGSLCRYHRPLRAGYYGRWCRWWLQRDPVITVEIF